MSPGCIHSSIKKTKEVPIWRLGVEGPWASMAPLLLERLLPAGLQDQETDPARPVHLSKVAQPWAETQVY